MTEEPTEALVSVGRKAINHRRFMAKAGTTVFSVAIMKPERAKGTQVNSRIRIGLIGCGKRGIWLTGLFRAHRGYEIVAGADYFPDRLDAFAQTYHIPAKRLYGRLSGYKRMLTEADIDAVVIESPPYFHPEQAGAETKAGTKSLHEA